MPGAMLDVSHQRRTRRQPRKRDFPGFTRSWHWDLDGCAGSTSPGACEEQELSLSWSLLDVVQTISWEGLTLVTVDQWPPQTETTGVVLMLISASSSLRSRWGLLAQQI